LAVRIRVERIHSVGSFLEWCLDQAGHAALVLAAVCPVMWLGWWGVPISGALVLSVREVEQWRRKSDIKKLSDLMLPWYLRHTDRILDVVIGAGLAWWVLS
jgi:hypothetical protein